MLTCSFCCQEFTGLISVSLNKIKLHQCIIQYCVRCKFVSGCTKGWEKGYQMSLKIPWTAVLFHFQISIFNP